MPTTLTEQFPHVFEIAVGTSRGAYVMLWMAQAVLAWRFFRESPYVLRVIVFLVLEVGLVVPGYPLLFP